MAKVLREVSFNALHILGSLGTTDLTPIQAMYAAAPTMGIADGVDEVHKATVARRVLRDYQPHDGDFPTEFLPYKREAGAREDAARCSTPALNWRPPPRRTRSTCRGAADAAPPPSGRASPEGEIMRFAIALLGVIVALFGLLFTLQGFGVVGGSPMSNTTTWSILGPIIALIGLALAVGGLRRRKR